MARRRRVLRRARGQLHHPRPAAAAVLSCFSLLRVVAHVCRSALVARAAPRVCYYPSLCLYGLYQESLGPPQASSPCQHSYLRTAPAADRHLRRVLPLVNAGRHPRVPGLVARFKNTRPAKDAPPDRRAENALERRLDRVCAVAFPFFLTAFV
ncbi:hypothetical protein B0H14DRAFT_562650 [Mycena olivaceomarginata]|nr:hypothetical protein B0H14DRAFT_562650 [Mycena olivaceomarginata]